MFTGHSIPNCPPRSLLTFRMYPFLSQHSRLSYCSFLHCRPSPPYYYPSPLLPFSVFWCSHLEWILCDSDCSPLTFPTRFLVIVTESMIPPLLTLRTNLQKTVITNSGYACVVDYPLRQEPIVRDHPYHSIRLILHGPSVFWTVS